jgi:hypothetical protein
MTTRNPAKKFGILLAAATSLLMTAPARAANPSAMGNMSTATSASKADVLRDVVRKFASHEKIEPGEFQAFVKAQNDDLKTGPPIGAKVPGLALADENGKRWTLHDLMGRDGLLLVFTRSADW